MASPRIVSPDQWLAARKTLLAKEKAFTRARDALSAERREMPWVKIEKPYSFDTGKGRKTLAELFEGRSQLLVYHFMFAPEWKEGCKSCSFWADNYNGVDIHLAHRDVTLMAISAAPLATLEMYKKRMGWTFTWASSAGSDFNADFHVSFTPDQLKSGKVDYNYEIRGFPETEAPGISVFAKDAAGAVYHTYSTYARGLDMLNGAYHLLDLTPKGRDEGGRNMFWLRRRDQYED
jgi:predicted dithiol-disulfide oxidoreductase (DUF899 family)